ncbi:MAG: Transglutaminase-like enzyme putative cysteine protease, partial [Chthonomonadales bacterium]|nr:Transglutaminase-like enzyme putative cysteine protease [Chthonomonadales bacterium]
LGFFFLLSLLFGQGVGVAESPSRNLQIALTWVAILHSYTLSNNAAVLFACVPGMTLIALVSTSTTEIEAQNAFLVFFSAATFLLVHENYLRTQANTRSKPEARRRPALFSSQFALAVGCFLGAIILAHATVLPMHFVGERLFPPNAINALHGAIQKTLPSGITNNERTNYELASGPVSATDTPLLEVKCAEPLYWRGGTFDKYTGHSFTNTLSSTSLNTEDHVNQYMKDQTDANQASHYHFKLPPGTLDIPESDMKDSRVVRQHFKTLTVASTQMYGAGRVKELDSPVYSLQTDSVGALTVSASLTANSEYDVVSVAPSFSPDVLRASPNGPIPPEIQEHYLQTATPAGAQNPVLAALAAKWTEGKTTNYAKAKAIQQHITETCRYNLNTPAAPHEKDRVEYFLTESQQGYCDSFGAAMTMMCRYAGIPARMALGFLHGESTGPNTYTVKDKDRHIWSEVFFPDVGWVVFDATDGANDISAQSETAKKKKSTLLGWLMQQGFGPKVIELILVVLLAYLVKTELIDRLRPRSRKPGMPGFVFPSSNLAIHHAYAAAVKQLARKGMIRTASMTAVEFGTLVQSRITTAEVGVSLKELTELLNRYYYGNETASSREVEKAQNALNRLTEALRQVKAESGKGARVRQSATA